ncbi:uncharacterized protein A4U43_C04F9900 [Asparagus officinalis]|uniref:non-specific serine/threonine protein kinase n=1 Tax=Asparagus officinalis TaxID=4686 RepID=A0A5P1F457_ASPOF|nr:uncharacterized protein A4U43_C04F9900 [Asparagus officinalis]
MKQPPPRFLSVQVVFLLSIFSFPQQPASRKYTNLTDLESLLAFKAQVRDPHAILSTNWTSNTSFCNWIGVSCSRRHHERVTAIDFLNFPLQGTISPHLSNLSFLSRLDLANCSLAGSIPQVLSQLPRLEELYLEENSLYGSIPTAIFNMSSLVQFFCSDNNLSGTLISNGSNITLPRLQRISLSANQLTGEIPSSFAQCRDLESLSLSLNEFNGIIPADLGSLTELRKLYLGGNRLSGIIPKSLGNLTKLDGFDLSINMLTGIIPKELGNLANLQNLLLGDNGFSGSIPTSLLNCSRIEIFELAVNNLTGPVPASIGKSMPLLTRLLLGGNRLSGDLDFITSLSNCRDLYYLHLIGNELRGVLPSSIGNLSINLQHLFAGLNFIRGEVPTGLKNLSNLVSLHLGGNELIGTIPLSFPRLEKLQYMSLHGNGISGSIPSELGLLRSLNVLRLENNRLVGPIPYSISNISGIQYLALSGNRLSSNIPLDFWSLTSLIELHLSKNMLDGLLPSVGSLEYLNILDLSSNMLSGNLSSSLGRLQVLTHLDLSNNSFEGQIPSSLSGLISIKYLNLSNNFLSGDLPKSLANLSYLEILDLSFNKLEGQIPEGRVFSNLSIPSLEGNTALCGAPLLDFPPCPSNAVNFHSTRKLQLIKYILPPILFVVLGFASFCLIRVIYQRRKKITVTRTVSTGLDEQRVISYLELVRATENFSDANLVGKGSFGSVFRGCLDDGLTVAVKVLNLEVEGALKSFDEECRALSMVRHRNLIKIISICSNHDFKALVLQFMPNMSLERWIYGNNQCLDLLQRLNIMVDVSSALEYLHHHLPRTVLHCDLKPSNVLLDEGMVAHLGDFGIAKLMFGDNQSVVTATTRGTIGYIAPGL